MLGEDVRTTGVGPGGSRISEALLQKVPRHGAGIACEHAGERQGRLSRCRLSRGRLSRTAHRGRRASRHRRRRSRRPAAQARIRAPRRRSGREAGAHLGCGIGGNDLDDRVRERLVHGADATASGTGAHVRARRCGGIGTARRRRHEARHGAVRSRQGPRAGPIATAVGRAAIACDPRRVAIDPRDAPRRWRRPVKEKSRIRWIMEPECHSGPGRTALSARSAPGRRRGDGAAFCAKGFLADHRPLHESAAAGVAPARPGDEKSADASAPADHRRRGARRCRPVCRGPTLPGVCSGPSLPGGLCREAASFHAEPSPDREPAPDRARRLRPRCRRPWRARHAAWSRPRSTARSAARAA